MIHTVDVPTTDPGAVADAAIHKLTDVGFSIDDSTDGLVELATDETPYMRSNGLLVASQISIQQHASCVRITATLEGANRIFRQLRMIAVLMPIAYLFANGLFGGFIHGQHYDVGFGAPGVEGWRWIAQSLFYCLTSFVILYAFARLVFNWSRRRGVRALDQLADELAGTSEHA